MVPKMNGKEAVMSKETFERMMKATVELLDKGTYDQAHFRLSGGEPFQTFDCYKGIVTEYRKKYPKQMTFGVLTNFVRFDDEIADWMELNNMGMQISLDDLVDGKPLVSGASSSPRVLENIQKVQARNIPFSINTVLDVNKTKSLVPMANFVSSFRNMQWGLNASYTEKDDDKIEDVIKIFDECISHLVKRGCGVHNGLRFYNTVVGTGRGGCSAGVDSFAIGTELEVWSCQSWCDREPIGFFDENIVETLKKADGNSYFRDRRMMPACSDCSVLGYCRGGCRATHEDATINEVVCRIRRDVIGKLASGYYTQNFQNAACSHDHGAPIQKLLEDYASKNEDGETVETPPFPVG
jgi:radical SAM protein with 4Fe4S-binding SPASM domain